MNAQERNKQATPQEEIAVTIVIDGKNEENYEKKRRSKRDRSSSMVTLATAASSTAFSNTVESGSGSLSIPNGSSDSSICTTPEATNPEEAQEESQNKTFRSRLLAVYREYEFLFLVLLAIVLARAYPPLGAEYLRPEITSNWIAVCFIFVLAGLGLKTEEFAKAFQAIGFNLFVQGFSFGVVSATVYCVSRALEVANILSSPLADGMVATASLPMPPNMVFVLTKNAGGHEGLAIVNPATSNLIGVFLSPVLIMAYLGDKADVKLVEVFYKQACRVLLPVAVGQVFQKKVPVVNNFFKSHRNGFKKAQVLTVAFIVYCVFCRTFSNKSESNKNIGNVMIMISAVFVCLTSLTILAWFSLGLFWKQEPAMRVMGLFGCTQKTVSIGVPLINALYENSPSVGLYVLPLLIWHPMQLVMGSFLAPKLLAYVQRHQAQSNSPPHVDGSVDNDDVSQTEQPPNNEDNVEGNHAKPQQSDCGIAKDNQKGDLYARRDTEETESTWSSEDQEENATISIFEKI